MSKQETLAEKTDLSARYISDMKSCFFDWTGISIFFGYYNW